MLTQVHELSELLFKVTSGKINDEEEQAALFGGFDDGDDYANSVPDWDENFFASGSAQASANNFESDLGPSVVTSSGKYQNTFTITELQSKPKQSKKRAGKRSRRWTAPAESFEEKVLSRALSQVLSYIYSKLTKSKKGIKFIFVCLYSIRDSTAESELLFTDFYYFLI